MDIYELAARFHTVVSNGGFTTHCPAHDDRHDSLSVSRGESGNLLVKCHAGCNTEAVLHAVGLEFNDLFYSVVKSKQARADRIAAVYSYTDLLGQPLFEVVRTEPKGFYQRRPDGMGGYKNSLGKAARVLYRLPEVAAARGCNKTILLCEGEKDVENVRPYEAAVGFVATTAPMGAGKWREEYTHALAGAKVVIAPDNDLPGETHARAVCAALTQAGCGVRVARVTELAPDLADVKGADISDLIARGDPEKLLKRLLSPRPAGVLDASALVMELARPSPEVHTIPTGFVTLDARLCGGLYPGLHVIGALSSLGKTALVGQIADFMRERAPVLFFTLEMAAREMAARSLARAAFFADPSEGCKKSAVYALSGGMADTAAGYSGAGLYFMEEGVTVSAVRSIALEMWDHLGEPPVVIVDYLQVLAPTRGFSSDKQAVDESVLSLKRLSRELCSPVIAVSSFNRASYAADAGLSAFKESGSIEYAADTVMALQARGVAQRAEQKDSFTAACAADIARMTLDARQKEPRPLELVILKNRRGPAYSRVNLDFFAVPGAFAEV